MYEHFCSCLYKEKIFRGKEKKFLEVLPAFYGFLL